MREQNTETPHIDVWDYADCKSATLQQSTCPCCGQEVQGGMLRGSLWHQLVTLAANADGDLGKLFAQRERKAGAEARAAINQRSTYRVQKNLLLRCAAAGVPLLDARGRPRGKTAIEKELRSRTQ